MPARPVGSQCGTVRMSHHSAGRRSRLPSAPFRDIQRRQHRPGRAAETPAATAETAARRAGRRPLESAWAHSFPHRSFRQSRPGHRRQWRGVDALLRKKTLALVGVCVNRTGKVRSFFDEVSQSWLMRFLEHRIADPRILHLIQKWLKAGILEDGVVTVSDKGTGQGSVILPLLANIYLHYSLDLWAERWR